MSVKVVTPEEREIEQNKNNRAACKKYYKDEYARLLGIIDAELKKIEIVILVS